MRNVMEKISACILEYSVKRQNIGGGMSLFCSGFVL